MIHVHVTKNAGHFQGMADIRFAAFAVLTLVCQSAELIGAAYFFNILGGEVTAYPFFKFGNGCHNGNYNLHFRKKGQNPVRTGASGRLTRLTGWLEIRMEQVIPIPCHLRTKQLSRVSFGLT